MSLILSLPGSAGTPSGRRGLGAWAGVAGSWRGSLSTRPARKVRSASICRSSSVGTMPSTPGPAFSVEVFRAPLSLSRASSAASTRVEGSLGSRKAMTLQSQSRN